VPGAFTWYQVKVAGGSFYAGMNVPPPVLDDAVALWALTSLIPLMVLGFVMLAAAGYWVGERVLVDEFEQGSLGALLITPLKDRQIILARIVARIIGSLIGPTVLGVCSFLLLCVALKNPANATFIVVWIVVQALSIAVFFWGVAGGVSISTLVMRWRWLRGGSLIAAFAGPGLVLWLTWIIFPSLGSLGYEDTVYWMMGAGLAVAPVVCVLAVAFAYVQFKRFRRGDIAYGDQPSG